MTSTASGRRVEGGLWWNGGTWTLRSIGEAGGTLPETGSRWHRVPGWLMLPLAPVVGGAFVVALPVVGAVLVARAVAQLAVRGGGKAARDLAATVGSPAPRPGEAHLTGAPDREAEAPGAAGPAPGQGEPLEEVEAEVAARKAGKPAPP